ncbi:GTPase Era [Spirochaetia bacterium]|nr:GTPase Era [Spirochaetia bacterium]
MENEKKSAFVAVIGRPSAGKSTLINKFCNAKVSIVSATPQTTRNSIRGIVTQDAGQLVFVDTPGRHKSEKKLNLKLVQTADRVQNESDLILYVLDATRKPGPEEENVAANIPAGMLGGQTFIAINKIDSPNADTAASYNFIKKNIPLIKQEHIFEISALNGTGTDSLGNALFLAAPIGPLYYDTEMYTDQSVKFRIAEIIREQTMNRLREELPHAIYVEVADAELKEPKDDAGTEKLWVRAFILTERESQKGMVVGKNGKMIRAIRLASLAELSKIFDWKIDLDLRVKTSRDWRQDDSFLRNFV